MRKMKRMKTAIGLLGGFALWTMAVCLVDVAPIGPRGSLVGLATVNGWFHRLTGTNMLLYTLTDWLGLLPIAVCVCFAGMGLCQWIQRKDLRKVDADVLLLGGFYVVTMAVYLLFETVVINYRPVLIHHILEVSYPSSTTLLTLCVMLTAVSQVRRRIHCQPLRRFLVAAILLFTVFMVVGRLISGVHWLTDVVGGIWLSGGLVALYDALCLTFSI